MSKNIRVINRLSQKDLSVIGDNCNILLYLLDENGDFFSYLNGERPGGVLGYFGNGSMEFFVNVMQGKHVSSEEFYD